LLACRRVKLRGCGPSFFFTMEYKHLIKELEPKPGEYVQLIDVMPHPSTNVWPETAVVNAARVSYLGESKGEEADLKLLKYLLKHRHTSPFEHVIFKFRITAPVVVWWQWVRHRTWSFNFQSGRYVEFDETQVWDPMFWRLQSKSSKQGSDGYVDDETEQELNQLWDDAQQAAMRNYRFALDKEAAKEQARLFLPGFAMMYQAICTIDAHNLMHFLDLRMQKDAQYEIRMYANEIFEIFNKFMPNTAAWLREGIALP
jgi:thymidylate synthase (FAD)